MADPRTSLAAAITLSQALLACGGDDASASASATSTATDTDAASGTSEVETDAGSESETEDPGALPPLSKCELDFGQPLEASHARVVVVPGFHDLPPGDPAFASISLVIGSAAEALPASLGCAIDVPASETTLRVFVDGALTSSQPLSLPGGQGVVLIPHGAPSAPEVALDPISFTPTAVGEWRLVATNLAPDGDGVSIYGQDAGVSGLLVPELAFGARAVASGPPFTQLQLDRDGSMAGDAWQGIPIDPSVEPCGVELHWVVLCATPLNMPNSCPVYGPGGPWLVFRFGCAALP